MNKPVSTRKGQRVWVVLDKRTSGRGWMEIPLLGTVARTRTESIRLYDQGHEWEWLGNSYTIDKTNGWVRCVTATLTTKAKKRKPKGAGQ